MKSKKSENVKHNFLQWQEFYSVLQSSNSLITSIIPRYKKKNSKLWVNFYRKVK